MQDTSTDLKKNPEDQKTENLRLSSQESETNFTNGKP
jgi:hypothetical protein